MRERERERDLGCGRGQRKDEGRSAARQEGETKTCDVSAGSYMSHFNTHNRVVVPNYAIFLISVHFTFCELSTIVYILLVTIRWT